MRRYLAAPLFTLMLMALMLPAIPAHATSPCMRMNEADFTKQVLEPSDTVVLVKIDDFSDKQDFNDQWTKVSVVEALYPTEFSEQELVVRGWQSYYEPLYPYKKGEYLILFLKKSDGNYLITDLAWKSCVPSVWGVDEKKRITFRAFESKGKKDQMSVDELKRWVLSYKQPNPATTKKKQ